MNFGTSNQSFVNESENPGGIQVIAWWIPFAHLDLPIPYMKPNPQNDQEAAVLTGDYQPTSGKHFIEIYGTYGKGSFEGASSAELDSSGEEATLKLFIPGTEKELEALVRRQKATKMAMIFALTDAKRRAMGYDGFPCYLSEYKKVTGEGIMGIRGYEMTYKSHGISAAPLYEGPIQLSGSTLPPVS